MSGFECRKRKRQQTNEQVPLRTYRIEDVGSCVLPKLLNLLESGNISLICGPNNLRVDRKLLEGNAHIIIRCAYPSSRMRAGDDKIKEGEPEPETYVMVVEKSTFRKALKVMKSSNVRMVTIRVFEDHLRITAYNAKFGEEYDGNVAASVSTDEIALRDRGSEIRYSKIISLPGKYFAEKITDAGPELSIWHEAEKSRLRLSTQGQAKNLTLGGYLPLPNQLELETLLDKQEQEIKEALAVAGENEVALDPKNDEEDEEFRDSYGVNATTLINKFIAVFGSETLIEVKFELGCPMSFSGKLSEHEKVKFYIMGKIPDDD